MRFPEEAVVFEYVPVDDLYMNSGGAALDYVLEAGDIIQGAGRCCENCTLIWGFFGGEQNGGFTTAEFRPLTKAAQEMLALVNKGGNENGREDCKDWCEA